MYLVSCLDSADVADAAALSLKNVCDTYVLRYGIYQVK